MVWKMRVKHRPFLALLLSIMLSAVLVLPVWAGDGDGSGGGQGVPLGLASSSPAHGEQNVSTTPEINLIFNKNVVNMTVADNNKKCFSLYAADGQKVPLEVIMPDDQIQPELKRHIDLKPLQALEPGTTYTLKISPQLQAKNGTFLGTEAKVSFTTAGTRPQAEEPKQTSAPEREASQNPDTAVASDNTGSDSKTVQTTEPEAPERNEETAGDKPSPEVASSNQPEADSSDRGVKPIVIGVLILIVIAGAGYAYYVKRKK